MLYGVRSQMSLCCITGGGGQESHIHCHHHHNRDNRDNHDNHPHLYLLREILHATVLSCCHHDQCRHNHDHDHHHGDKQGTVLTRGELRSGG